MTSPLQGVHVLVTRSITQAKSLSEKIIESGGVPIETPLLTYVEFNHNEDKDLPRIEQFDWIFFTSVNGVSFFFEKLDFYLGEDKRIPCRIGVVGEKTKEAVEDYGYEPHFVPSQYTASTFAREFSVHYQSSQSILLIQGNLNRPTLQRSLTNKGHRVSSLSVYKTEINYEIKEKLQNTLANKKIDVLTFASPSTIQAFLNLGGEIAQSYKSVLVACIGPTTSEEAEKFGFKNIITPELHTVDGIISEIENYYKS